MGTMSYENAPATKMLATRCAVCAHPLVDAMSVEIGLGPDCRAKYGYDHIHDCSEEDRAEANRLVYEIACDQKGTARIASNSKRLFELGFSKLIVAILRRVATVQIGMTDDTHAHGAGRLAVKTPYSEEAVTALRQVPGRRWDAENKVNTFPASSRVPLFQALQKLFPGATAIGPKGPFVFPENQDGSTSAESKQVA